MSTCAPEPQTPSTLPPIHDLTPVRETAALLHVTPSTIRRRLRTSPDELPPHIRVSGLRILFINVADWLEERARRTKR